MTEQARARRRRRALAIGGLVALGLVLAFGLASARALVRWIVGVRVVPSLEERLGRRIGYERIQVGWGEVVLTEVVVRGPADAGREPLLRVEAARLELEVRALLRGAVRVHAIELEGARLELRREDEQDNASDLPARLRARAGPGGRRWPRVTVRGGSVALVDEDRDRRVEVQLGATRPSGEIGQDCPGAQERETADRLEALLALLEREGPLAASEVEAALAAPAGPRPAAGDPACR